MLGGGRLLLVPKRRCCCGGGAQTTPCHVMTEKVVQAFSARKTGLPLELRFTSRPAVCLPDVSHSRSPPQNTITCRGVRLRHTRDAKCLPKHSVPERSKIHKEMGGHTLHHMRAVTGGSAPEWRSLAHKKENKKWDDTRGSVCAGGRYY